jgi:DNA-directed RNA polymerase specialized sigma24 family protein
VHTEIVEGSHRRFGIRARTDILPRVSGELHQAFAVLLEGETGPAARSALEAVRAAALRMARADGRRPADHDDCAQEVAFKLWKRLAMGDCPVRVVSAGACAGYVRTMVTHWLTDRQRRERARRSHGERLRHESASRPESAEEQAVSHEDEAHERARASRVRALLERLARSAIERRQPRHRAHLEQGWREISAMVFEGTPLSVLLAGELGTRARDAAYKRHQRTREALEDALDALAIDGGLDGEELELGRLAIAALARCQRTGASGVDEESS